MHEPLRSAASQATSIVSTFPLVALTERASVLSIANAQDAVNGTKRQLARCTGPPHSLVVRPRRRRRSRDGLRRRAAGSSRGRWGFGGPAPLTCNGQAMTHSPGVGAAPGTPAVLSPRSVWVAPGRRFSEECRGRACWNIQSGRRLRSAEAVREKTRRICVDGYRGMLVMCS